MEFRTLSFATFALGAGLGCKATTPPVPLPTSPGQAVVIAPAPDAGGPNLLFTREEALARIQNLCTLRDVNIDSLRKPWEAPEGEDSCDAPENVQNAIARAARMLGREWEVDSVGCEHGFGRVVMLRHHTTDVLHTARWTPKKTLERTPLSTWSEADLDGDGVMETLHVADAKPAQASRAGRAIWADGNVVFFDLRGQIHVRVFEGQTYLIDNVAANLLFFAPRDLRVFRIDRLGVHLEPDLPQKLWQASKAAREQYPPLCSLQEETGWAALNLEVQIAMLGEDRAHAHALSVALNAAPSEQPEREGDPDREAPAGFESPAWANLWPSAAVHCAAYPGDEPARALATTRAIELANTRGELLLATRQVLGCDGLGRTLLEQETSGMLHRNHSVRSKELYRVGAAATLEDLGLRGELAPSGDFTGDGRAESLFRIQDGPLMLTVMLLTGESLVLRSQWSMAALASIRLPRDDRDSLLVTRDNDGDPDVRVFRFDGTKWQEVPRVRYQALYQEASRKFNVP